MVWFHPIFCVIYTLLELCQLHEAVDASVLANTLLYPVSVAAANYSSVNSGYINGLPSIFFGPVKNVSVNLAYNPAGSGVISVTNSSSGVSITFPLPPNTLSNVSRVPVYGFPPYAPAPTSSYSNYGYPGYAVAADSSYGSPSYNGYNSASPNTNANNIPQIKYVYGPVNLQYQAPIFPALDYSRPQQPAPPYSLPVYETSFPKGDQYIAPMPETNRPYSSNSAYNQYPPPSYDRGTIYDTKYPLPPQVSPYYPNAPAPYYPGGNYNTGNNPYATPAYSWKYRTTYGPYPVSNTTVLAVTTTAASKVKVEPATVSPPPTANPGTTTPTTKPTEKTTSAVVEANPPLSSKIGAINTTEEVVEDELTDIEGLNDTLSEDANSSDDSLVDITLPPEPIVEITLPPVKVPITTTTRKPAATTAKSTSRPTTGAVIFKFAAAVVTTRTTPRPTTAAKTTARVTFPPAKRFLILGKTLSQNSTLSSDTIETTENKSEAEKTDSSLSEMATEEAVPAELFEDDVTEATTTTPTTRHKKFHRRKTTTRPKAEEDDYPEDDADTVDEITEGPRRRRKNKRRRLVLISTAVDVDEGALTGFDYEDNDEDERPRRKKSKRKSRKTTTTAPLENDTDNGPEGDDLSEEKITDTTILPVVTSKRRRTFARKVPRSTVTATGVTGEPLTSTTTTTSKVTQQITATKGTVASTMATVRKATANFKAKPAITTTSASLVGALKNTSGFSGTTPTTPASTRTTKEMSTAITAGSTLNMSNIATPAPSAATPVSGAAAATQASNSNGALTLTTSSDRINTNTESPLPSITVTAQSFQSTTAATQSNGNQNVTVTAGASTNGSITSNATGGAQQESDVISPKTVALQDALIQVDQTTSTVRPPLNPAYFGPSSLISMFNEPTNFNAPHRFVRPAEWGITPASTGRLMLSAL
ncbi:mucin-5AC-like [Paramacrobiotus metropolitanus]|uniref:mucin-5AC-like n=1 Tax=Paramacrobiotus metropolitanus TaxID=2943436 RepID=UPI0024461C18|nr:mucin-5AC-like [Paramacrobiotus metropolitanus]